MGFIHRWLLRLAGPDPVDEVKDRAIQVLKDVEFRDQTIARAKEDCHKTCALDTAEVQKHITKALGTRKELQERLRRYLLESPPNPHVNGNGAH
jgi:hypothetical protein